MKLVILSAGKGMRLRPLTNKIPKCLIEVAGKAILKHQLDLFINRQDIEQIVIVIGYKAMRTLKEPGRTIPIFLAPIGITFKLSVYFCSYFIKFWIKIKV